MKTPEIYMEVDPRELSLTDGDVLYKRLLVLGVVCPGSSKAFLFTRQEKNSQLRGAEDTESYRLCMKTDDGVTMMGSNLYY